MNNPNDFLPGISGYAEFRSALRDAEEAEKFQSKQLD